MVYNVLNVIMVLFIQRMVVLVQQEWFLMEQFVHYRIKIIAKLFHMQIGMVQIVYVSRDIAQLMVTVYAMGFN